MIESEVSYLKPIWTIKSCILSNIEIYERSLLMLTTNNQEWVSLCKQKYILDRVAYFQQTVSTFFLYQTPRSICVTSLSHTALRLASGSEFYRNKYDAEASQMGTWSCAGQLRKDYLIFNNQSFFWIMNHAFDISHFLYFIHFVL